MSTLLQDKVFVFAGRSKPSDSELEILQLIADQENLGPISSVETIKNGENYDSYKLTINGQGFLTKLSLDEKNSFGYESLILDSLSHLAPKKVCYGALDFGDSIYYLITEWENAQSIQELGHSVIISEKEKLLKTLEEIHNIELPIKSFQEYLSELFDQTSFEKHSNFAELVEQNTENYQLLLQELESAKKNIQQNFKDYYASKTIIHGNLSENTILVGGEGFKIINWENSFCAHPLFELAIAETNFDFGESFSFSLLKDSQYSWPQYLEIKAFWTDVFLLKVVFSFIKEIYLYGGKRHKEMLELSESFYRNSKKFEKNETFKKNKSELLKLFNQVAF